MKFIKVEQGSEAWHQARLGVATSSEFDQIITAGGKPSASAPAYMHQLIAERLLNAPSVSLDGLHYIDRGKALEPKAAGAYCIEFETELAPGGFFTTDDGFFGCSPDRLIDGGRRGLEIKCPGAPKHVGYKISGPGKDYRQQVQGQIYVATFDAVEFFSFHPQMPSVRIVTQPDREYQPLLIGELNRFRDAMQEALAVAQAWGYFAAHATMPMPLDAAYSNAEAYTIDAKALAPAPAPGPVPGTGTPWQVCVGPPDFRMIACETPQAFLDWWAAAIAQFLGRRALLKARKTVEANTKIWEALERESEAGAAAVHRVRVDTAALLGTLASSMVGGG